MDWSRRSTAPELMDVAEVDQADFDACLADLETVNRWTRAAAPTLGFLDRLTAGWAPGRVLRVADIGFGRGDLLRRIHGWATARGLRPVLTGIDLNPRCLAAAQALTAPGTAIDWRCGDLFDWQPDPAPDVILSALFAHHLDDAALVRFLAWQDRLAVRGWFVNDLHRHPLAWGGFWAWSRAAGWHRFVQHDGPLSVRRAFTRADWARLLLAAGVNGAQTAWHWPFRLCVGRLKDG